MLSFRSSGLAEESFKSPKDISTHFRPYFASYLGFSASALMSFRSAKEAEISPFSYLTLSSGGLTDYPRVWYTDCLISNYLDSSTSEAFLDGLLSLISDEIFL
jgi:hypothetical protein